MADFQSITADEVKQKMMIENVVYADVRDKAAYDISHIENAIHLTQESLQEFIAKINKQSPVVVYCYHGNSSKRVAKLLASEGFQEVYSLTGGYAAWE